MKNFKEYIKFNDLPFGLTNSFRVKKTSQWRGGYGSDYFDIVYVNREGIEVVMDVGNNPWTESEEEFNNNNYERLSDEDM